MTSWIIGNWKLNPVSVSEAATLAKDVAQQATALTSCQLMIAPSSLHLSAIKHALSSDVAPCKGVVTSKVDSKVDSIDTSHHKKIQLVAQDMTDYTATTGAFKGDISAKQLQDIGAAWVILGHSERRQYYNEGNELLFKKMVHGITAGLGVILCIGESEAQYEAQQTQAVLNEQLAVISDVWKSLLPTVSSDEVTRNNSSLSANNLSTSSLNTSSLSTNGLNKGLIIAYEPVWAIGTGKVPSVDEVTQVHSQIRDYLGGIDSRLKEVAIIYGGSVKPANAKDFASSPLIDGVLVGGAALNAKDFIDIALAFESSTPNIAAS